MNTGFPRSRVPERGRRLSTCEAVKQPTGGLFVSIAKWILGKSSLNTMSDASAPLALTLSRGGAFQPGGGAQRGKSRSKGLVLGGSDRRC
ncbi:hypothetical protein VZT92_006589 [Zoarces viviparus]|uniref:Uncharacterized protein n=1 Tax=Zoarces viviparus TaxID=48416 RepID=A0AAW1FQF9_ZOAVI